MQLSGKQGGGKRSPRGGMFKVLLHQDCVPQSHKLESYSLDLRVGSQPQTRPLQRGWREHGVTGLRSHVTGSLREEGIRTDTQGGTTPWGPRGGRPSAREEKGLGGPALPTPASQVSASRTGDRERLLCEPRLWCLLWSPQRLTQVTPGATGREP